MHAKSHCIAYLSNQQEDYKAVRRKTPSINRTVGAASHGCMGNNFRKKNYDGITIQH